MIVRTFTAVKIVQLLIPKFVPEERKVLTVGKLKMFMERFNHFKFLYLFF